MSTSESGRSSARRRTGTEKGIEYQKEHLKVLKDQFNVLVKKLTQPEIERSLGVANPEAIADFEKSFAQLEQVAANVLRRLDLIIGLSASERDVDNWTDHKLHIERIQQDKLYNIAAIYERSTGMKVRTSKSPSPPPNANPHDLSSGQVVDVQDVMQSLAARQSESVATTSTSTTSGPSAQNVITTTAEINPIPRSTSVPEMSDQFRPFSSADLPFVEQSSRGAPSISGTSRSSQLSERARASREVKRLRREMEAQRKREEHLAALEEIERNEREIERKERESERKECEAKRIALMRRREEEKRAEEIRSQLDDAEDGLADVGHSPGI